jgi:DhnA family fructose-bisphosphate aldolase class Ia
MKASNQKLFCPDGRALFVAMDHARDSGPLPGLANPGQTIQQMIASGTDGIMTTYGLAKQYGQMMSGQVRLVVRLDGWSSIYRERWPQYSSWQQLYSVEAAVRLGADAVICNYFLGAAGESASLAIVGRCAEEADRLGIPLVVEAVPCAGPNLADPNDAKHLAVAARIAAEHGADLVKTFYSGATETFRLVTDTCPVPVLIAGGPMLNSALDVLRLVYGGMQAGAKGVFLGKNIWAASDPAGMVRAVSAIIHAQVPPEEALRELAQTPER